MILAGIDEAGYGPILGPLTVGACAMRVPGDIHGEIPDVWHLLRSAVSSKRDRTGRKLHVNDSKKVYSPSAGLAELEKSVLAWAKASDVSHESIDAMLATVDAAPADRAKLPWYAPAGEIHPAENSTTSIAIAGNGLKHACESAGVAPLSPRMAVVVETTYNRLCEATRNKAATLQAQVARLLGELLENHAREGLLIVCDRQGGRSHYDRWLRQMFPDFDLAVLAESSKRAEYLLTRGSAAARIIFAEKGDGLALPTAMASMWAKYIRERLMGRFNAFWLAAAGDAQIKPTAGYWTDGLRFLEDIKDARAELGVPDRALIRSR